MADHPFSNRGGADFPGFFFEPGVKGCAQELVIDLEGNGKLHVGDRVLFLHGSLAFARYWSIPHDIATKAPELAAKRHD
jgi:hypothetical protein